MQMFSELQSYLGKFVFTFKVRLHPSSIFFYCYLSLYCVHCYYLFPKLYCPVMWQTIWDNKQMYSSILSNCICIDLRPPTKMPRRRIVRVSWQDIPYEMHGYIECFKIVLEALVTISNACFNNPYSNWTMCYNCIFQK